MKIIQRLSSSAWGRRRFCRSLAWLAAGAVVGRLPPASAASSITAIEQGEFVVVNGWVLTREDVAMMELTPDAVRLQ
jgi:hypothetical protein